MRHAATKLFAEERITAGGEDLKMDGITGRIERLRAICVWIALLAGLLPAAVPMRSAADDAPRTWGRIANPEHAGEKIANALFFAGPPNPGTPPLWTRHPKDRDLTRWSTDAQIDGALAQMTSVGINVMKVSYFGHDGESDKWAPTWLFSRKRWSFDAAPGADYTDAEQIAVAAHCFERAQAQKLLFAPFLEVSPSFRFYADFPDNLDNLVDRCSWWVKSFGKAPNWVRIYDRTGEPRYAIWLIESIHGSRIDPEQFARGFDEAAHRVEAATGFRIGFILDPTPLPAYGSHEGPDPTALSRHRSVLAINPFNICSQGLVRKEKQEDISEAERLEYAEWVLKRWSVSGIPLIAPLLPGYDAHLIFPKNGVYGFNPAWRESQRKLALQYNTDGISVDIWNGWSEGYGIPPTEEDGDVHMRWLAETIRAIR